MSETDEMFLDRMNQQPCSVFVDFIRLLSLARRGAAVPDEPTGEMRLSGLIAKGAITDMADGSVNVDTGIIYRSMLATALKDNQS